MNGIEASDLSVITAEQDAAVTGPLGVFQLPSGSCDSRPQQVNIGVDEITCMHSKDFHGDVFPLGCRVTADRIYRILTVSKELEKVDSFTFCFKICFGGFDHKWKTYWDPVIQETSRQVCDVM